MKKNHRRKLEKVIPSEPQQMRKRELTRAYKALRSAELTKARQLVSNQFNEELANNERNIRANRPDTRQGSVRPVTLGRLPSESQVRKAPLSAQVRDAILDNVRAVVCASRKTRKEVMFALQKTGKAGKGNKRANWTDKSRIRCK